MSAVRMVPVGELKPAPWNPRIITEERFKNLQRALASDPGFLELRPILAMADGTIYAGNMRFRAAVALGRDAVPAIVEDVDEAVAKQRAVRDNEQWGEWQEEELSELLAGIQAEGGDVAVLGLDERELERLVGVGDGQVSGPPEDPLATAVVCPRCGCRFEVART